MRDGRRGQLDWIRIRLPDLGDTTGLQIMLEKANEANSPAQSDSAALCHRLCTKHFDHVDLLLKSSLSSSPIITRAV